jgi:hypothetical protein
MRPLEVLIGVVAVALLAVVCVLNGGSIGLLLVAFTGDGGGACVTTGVGLWLGDGSSSNSTGVAGGGSSSVLMRCDSIHCHFD